MSASATFALDGFTGPAAWPSRTTGQPLDIQRRVPPSAWARLPPEIRRRFEPGHPATTYIGTMDLQASAVGLVFARLAILLGSPLPTRRAIGTPVTVDVQPTAAGVAWVRQLGPGQLVRSVKSAGPGATLIEQTDGGLGMVLDVSVEDRCLVFTSRAFFLAFRRWRIPVPAVLTPGRCRVEHRAIDATRFRFTLTMTHPVWGTTFHQTGIFSDPETAP